MASTECDENSSGGYCACKIEENDCIEIESLIPDWGIIFRQTSESYCTEIENLLPD